MPRAYSYQIIVAPAGLPVTIAEVREHLRLSPTDPSDDYLTLLITAATDVAEKYTKRTFINTTFRTYRDFFECCIKLRRSKLQSLEEFKYLVSGTFTDVDTSLYYVTDENDFSKIILKETSSYPDDIDDQLQSIQIDFIAGYGADNTFVPESLVLAMLNHIAAMYENRGDCDQNLSDRFLEKSLPALSRLVYTQYRVMDLHDGCI